VQRQALQNQPFPRLCLSLGGRDSYSTAAAFIGESLSSCEVSFSAAT
jgi:hypothetical protein